MTGARPPRFARACLTRALPADVRDDVAGDLEERFQRDMTAMGPGAARWRYRRNALTFATRFLAERAGERLRGLGGFRLSMLDLRLAVRMLARYPGLTIIGGLAMASAIAIGASVFAFITMMLSPTLPLPEGDRVVSVQMRNVAANQFQSVRVYDFRRWQSAKSLTDMGAGRALTRNITTPDGLVDTAYMAEVTANTFDLLKLPAVRGRGLTTADEQPGAPPVAVISSALWKSRFASDPDVIGRSILIGEAPATVVGVMPDGMHFPATQDVWVPLALPRSAAPGDSLSLRVWARLAPGVRLAEAVAEFETIGAQVAAETPKTHERLRPSVMPYAQAMNSMNPAERLMVAAMNIFVALLLVLVSGNVALLMFARAATRESEILVRTALGASRARVIAQFFSEALVLATLAAIVGLVVASKGIKWGLEVFRIAANENAPLPFWFQPELLPLSIAYTVVLTLVAAGIAGILPAMKVTRGLQSRLRESSAGSGGLKFGGVWTLVIVVQVAITVTVPGTAFFVKRDAVQIEAASAGVPPSEVLSAMFDLDRDGTQSKFDAAVRLVERRLAESPGVVSVAIADRLPLMYHPLQVIEVDDGGAAPIDTDHGGYRVSVAAVGPTYFTTFDSSPVAGRVFSDADYVGPNVAVVNQSFSERVLGGRNPIGRRLRVKVSNRDQNQRQATGKWLEIVGIVRDLGTSHYPDLGAFYVPLQPGLTRTLYLAARARGDAKTLAPALRAIALKADPTLRISEVQPLSQIPDGELAFINFWFLLTVGLSVATLALSLTGIYAVMSFTVARRTREIGIRVALGSNPRRVVVAILRRPLLQVAAGVVIGAMAALLLAVGIFEKLSSMQVLAIAGYALSMFAVCLLACLVPTRRALRVDPIAALKTE